MKKQTLYTSLLLHAPIGFALIDKTYNIIQLNYKLARYLRNKRRRYYYGKTFKELLGKREWKKMLPDVKRAFDGKTLSEVSTVTFKDAKKKTRYAAVSYVPISANGVINSIGIIMRDITAEKEAEEIVSLYRDRLEQAQKAGRLGVFEWNIKTDSVWWSDQEEALFGVPPGQFKGEFKDWLNAVHRWDKRKFLKEIANCVKQKKDLDFEFRVRHPGNIIHWIKARGHMYLKNGKPYRMVGIHSDVTRRKQHEELLSFKAEASRILSSSLDFNATLTTVANLATEYIADWCVVDMVDKETKSIRLVAAAHRDPKKARWAKQIRKKYPVDMNANAGLPLVLKTGKPVYIPYLPPDEVLKMAKNEEQRKIIRKLGGVNSVIIVPITIGRKTIGAITFVSSESKWQYTPDDLEMAEQLASRAALAVENARLYENIKRETLRKDEFISLASHELKTPITTIKAFTQLLISIETNTISKEYLKKVESQVDKLTRLVKDLLDISKIHKNKFDLHKRKINLDSFLSTTILELQTIVKTHELHSTLNSQLEISADPDKLTQVITNLITNAVKYSPHSNIIKISCTRNNDQAEIKVKDYGVGINLEEQSQVFNRYFRANNGVRTAGLGIGLFLSREIIERHGGTISLKSKPNYGTTFTILLPIS